MKSTRFILFFNRFFFSNYTIYFFIPQIKMPNERTPLLSSPPPPPPPPWDARRSLIAGVLVLTTLTLERLAFYSLAANLFLLLNVGGWSARSAMTAVLWLVGVAHFSALGGGWLADGLVGRLVS